MKMPLQLLLTTWLIPATVICTQAQKIDYPDTFLQLLARTGIEFLEPLEAGYRDIYSPKNAFQNCHLAIRSAREDLEIRFFILPWSEDDALSAAPHVATTQVLANIATNSDEALISAIRPEKGKLLEDFNADWGMVYFFQPKPAFSIQPMCRMVALHKEGIATAFVFYLFDDAGNEALDLRYRALRFSNE